jgi:hypothetical protein
MANGAVQSNYQTENDEMLGEIGYSTNRNLLLKRSSTAQDKSQTAKKKKKNLFEDITNPT